MRLIDADELIKCIPLEEYNSRFAVMNAPTIEPQTEIIRCKDCKHRGTDNCPMFHDEWKELYDGDEFYDEYFFFTMTQ